MPHHAGDHSVDDHESTDQEKDGADYSDPQSD
jgi:hypothetical protein